MMERTDPQIVFLIRKIKDGDQVALKSLYRRYGELVFRTVCLILSDDGQIEKVTQDVFVHIFYERLDYYTIDKGDFMTWLNRIIVNICRNTQREWQQHNFSQEDEFPVDISPSSTVHTSLDRVLRNERQHRIWNAMQQLSIDLREVVVFSYFQNLKYNEIAEILDRSIDTVKSLIYAAYVQIQHILGEDVCELLSH